MKNQSDILRIAHSLRRLREGHAYDCEQLAAVLNMATNEYIKMESGRRLLSLAHLCNLSAFYGLRKSAILDYGNTRHKHTSQDMEDVTHKIASSEKTLSEILAKIASYERLTLKEKCFWEK